MKAERLTNARSSARNLREGKVLSFCDHTLSIENGKVIDTSMTYDSYIGSHTFRSVRLSFSEIRNTLMSGMFR